MSVIEEIQSYKKLLDDGIIEPDEYVKMKESAFNKISASDGGLNVLRELKELLDMGAITEDEYSSQKSRILNNELQSKEKKTITIPKIPAQAAKNMDFKSMLADKKRIAIIAAVGVLALIVLISVLGGGGKKLPGGVRFGDSYDKVMKAALALDPEAKESDYGGIVLMNANLYGYECYVKYDVSKDKPLESVVVSPSEGLDKNVLLNVVSELTKEYGSPTSSGVTDFGEDEAVWEFDDLVITATYYDDVMISFRKPY